MKQEPIRHEEFPRESLGAGILGLKAEVDVNESRAAPHPRNLPINLAMNAIERVFGKAHVLLPVVHVITEEQAIENTGRALDAGADGVFLIAHSLPHQRLIPIVEAVRHQFSRAWLGINFLDRHPVDAIPLLNDGIQGYWSDYTGVREDDGEQWEARDVDAARRKWPGIYFGGVAFKYQPAVRYIGCMARRASDFLEVLTTSGLATGQPPEVEKIRQIRQACPEHAIGIASGISETNVSSYPQANAFLVATSISRSFTELDETLTRTLAERIHQLPLPDTL